MTKQDSWPKPAPLHPDPAGEFTCSLDCMTVHFMSGIGWAAGLREIRYCPDCGRWLGEDADGNPVVGPPGWAPKEMNEDE